MKDIVKKYSNGEVTVVWKPNQCIHSTICFRGLGKVFNPQIRPWVNMEGANTEEIKAQIDKCPSGALSYELQHDEAQVPNTPGSEIKAEAIPNGPLLIEGTCVVKSSEGEITKTGKTFFCRCGSSANKPYCDGSHRKSGFVG